MNEERKGLRCRAFTPIRFHFGWVVQFLTHRSPVWTMSVSLLLLVVVGVVDYKTVFERSWLVFYLLPVALGTWFVDWRFGVILCALSVTVWIVGDIEAGAVYSSPSVPIWNASTAVIFFLVVVWLLHRLHSLLNQLEDRIRQGTADLRQEMKVRERLWKDVTETSRPEGPAIGPELHNSSGQSLHPPSLSLKVRRAK